MLFRMIYDDKLAQAAYLIGCQGTGDAIIIDPQRDVDRYIDAAKANKLRIVAVAETHIHADFLSGTRQLAEATGAKVYVSDEGDADWKYQWLNKRSGGGSYPHQLLKDGNTFRIGSIQFKVLHTPGHTPEHISFLVTDLGGGVNEPMGIITGDFVFVGDLGRPDLLETAAGVVGAKTLAARTLFRSARAFRQLPDYLQVWPAHGAGSACGKALGAVPQSTVGYEKRFNPSLTAADNEELFVQSILEGQPEPPLYFARMKHENKYGPAILDKLPQPAELDAAWLKKLDGKRVAILDTRPWAKFKAGHLPRALHAPLNSSFPTVAGSFVEAGTPIVLVIEGRRVEEAARDLVRIGLDEVTGFVTPQTLEAAAAQGVPLATTDEIDIPTLRRRINDGESFVLDVRKASEYQDGHIAGALNVAHTRLLDHLDELPKDRAILVHCLAGGRSALATALLQRHGFDATNIAGGFGAWQAAGGEVVRDADAVQAR
ncbi:MAG: MBL fold metallo-hydrolase [Phycisphaerales bacterium]|nr:MBL fold metallo-hydrolase [Phycisphaerales bacterium]MCI0629809.1 MBL fold metallo-hydrolase [Phycisphaerales bacterium]MCI0674691.1 MBL fold metallo-hydrolase [Phycisphaerales bacterium]